MGYIDNNPNSVRYTLKPYVDTFTFSGNGSQTAFTLPLVPTDSDGVQIYINGVRQNKESFGISGNTATFFEAPLSGTDNIQMVVFDSTLAFLDSNGVGGSSNVVLREVQTASAGQTVFVLEDFTYATGVNSLHIYLNGSKLSSGFDYSETSASSITLNVGATEDDIIEFISSVPTNSVEFRNLVATSSGEYIAVGGETVLNVKTLTGRKYLPGSNNVRVYINGSFMASGSDYQETSDTLVTLNEALTLNDKVVLLVGETISMSNVADEIAAIKLRLDALEAP